MAYCQYGEGTSDAVCAKFALEVETKVCKKKATENKCEEVEKTSEGDKDTTKESDKDDTTKDSDKDDTTKVSDKDDTTKDSDKDDTTKDSNKDDTTKDSDKDDTTKDSVEGTNKTNTTQEKNNSGKFINIGLGLLLLYALL